MKRLLALILTFILAVSVVTVGCAKKEEPKKPEVTAPAQPPAQQPAPPAEQKPAEAPKAPERPAEKK